MSGVRGRPPRGEGRGLMAPPSPPAPVTLDEPDAPKTTPRAGLPPEPRAVEARPEPEIKAARRYEDATGDLELEADINTRLADVHDVLGDHETRLARVETRQKRELSLIRFTLRITNRIARVIWKRFVVLSIGAFLGVLSPALKRWWQTIS